MTEIDFTNPGFRGILYPVEPNRTKQWYGLKRTNVAEWR